jgi:elongation factor 1-beta
MASKFLPLESAKQWGMLNGHLGAESYVGGAVATQEDEDVYKAMEGQTIGDRWVHVSRWYNHLSQLRKAGVDLTAMSGQMTSESQAEEELDLFGEETAAEKHALDERRQNAAASAKPAPIAASAVIFDVKPWGEDIDMAELEAEVRKVELPSLEWKASELVPVVGKIFALRILCHFTDDLFAVEEDLKAALENLEDHVQSVDIFAWNKR